MVQIFVVQVSLYHGRYSPFENSGSPGEASHSRPGEAFEPAGRGRSVLYAPFCRIEPRLEIDF